MGRRQHLKTRSLLCVLKRLQKASLTKQMNMKSNLLLRVIVKLQVRGSKGVFRVREAKEN